ncbi:MAG TPA: LysM peptidoglycan-binding domain-containing protein [Pyrinomonadaceae bacterium]|jgi:LysM repeat protein/protein-tyrosine-phosphatase|nr:LysM peptidoglycan-binding domain-containing protein [Pyrinomonadaceae bacterium]
MNFAFDYVKHKSKPQNDGFYFNIETPRGHFFTVLDFAPHDYANLNASLQGKLETIVSSFASVSSFSPDLFLGFLAKEINNFVHNLAEQSGEPELFCSGALCLVSGNQLSYFLCGDTQIKILNKGLLQPLQADSEPAVEASAQLGAQNLENPLADHVEETTLHEADVVLIMTRGVAEGLEQSPPDFLEFSGADSQAICDSLMHASAASVADRTLVVISGPYQPAAVADVSELQQSIAALEAKIEALTESEERRSSDRGRSELIVGAQFEQKFNERVAELKEYLMAKAAAIDLLELDDKVKSLSATIAGKADTAEMLSLQRDVLKLGLASSDQAPKPVVAEAVPEIAPAVTAAQPASAFTLNTALVVLLLSLIAGFVGGWLGSRRPRTVPEVWSVTTTESQITIGRKDGSNRGTVTLNVAQPLKTSGEQTFSSFTDVQRYLQTITSAENTPAPTSPNSEATPLTDNRPPVGVTEIRVKQGDSLKRLAQVYKVPPEKLMELNPSVSRWPAIRIGQKIFVPSSVSTASIATPTPTPMAPTSPVSEQAAQPAAAQAIAETSEVTVAPGDSLNKIARRYNTTAEQLKRLNPLTNWPRIQSGQKVLVPAPAG